MVGHLWKRKSGCEVKGMDGIALPAHLGCEEAVADGCLNVGRDGSKGIVGRIQNIAVFDRLLPVRRQLRVRNVD